MRVRQRIEQYAVHYGKQSRVRTDTQRQRENGDRRESRRFPKHPQAISHILYQFFKRSPAPHLPGDLLDQADIAQLSPCSTARFVFGFAAFRSVFDRHSQMALEFFVQFAFTFLTIPKGKCHASPSLFAGLSTPAMASESCAQRERSDSSCFLPLAVSR